MLYSPVCAATALDPSARVHMGSLSDEWSIESQSSAGARLLCFGTMDLRHLSNRIDISLRISIGEGGFADAGKDSFSRAPLRNHFDVTILEPRSQRR